MPHVFSKVHPISLPVRWLAVILLSFFNSSLQADKPVLWLDAGKADSFTIEAEGVAAWHNAIDRNATFSQTDEDRRPQFKTKLNNRTTLYFDGNDFLDGPAVLAEGDDTFTIVALWRPHRIAIQSVIEQAGRGTGRRAALLQVGRAYGFNGQSNDFHNAVKLKANEWRLTAMIVNGSARENVIVLDNDSEPVIGTVDIEKQNVGVDGILIGRKLHANGEFLLGDIAEIRVFDAVLAQKELEKQLSDVKSKWGLRFDSRVPNVVETESQKPKTTMPVKTVSLAEQIEFFESNVRPLFVEHCYECHSGDSKTIKAGLRLDGPEWLSKGGDSGPVVVPGNPNESLLIESVRWESYEMPPKRKLSDSQIAALVKWVEMGAAWPSAGKQPIVTYTKKDLYDWEKFRNEHWSYQPVVKPLLPNVSNQSIIQNETDHFISARLGEAGLNAVQPADSATLIRRMYFDLIGLPPTPEVMDRWIARLNPTGSDKTGLRQDAVAELIDHLLDSPHYGERWGRHWLDVARYSDGYGGFLDNTGLPHAWRYRDWVVEAFNRDLPFDEFVRLQIAGDVVEHAASVQGKVNSQGAVAGLPTEPQIQAGSGDSRRASNSHAASVHYDAIATGFFALGPTYRSDGGDPDSVAQAKGETLDDRVDTFSRAFLGLTVSCSRCHDHKFDPIPQQDYYSLAGVFNNSNVREFPLAEQDIVRKYNDGQKAINDLDKKIKDKQNTIKKEKREATDEETQQTDAWKKDLEKLKKNAPPKYDVAHALGESGSNDMKVAIRGNLRRTGESAPRRFLRILAGNTPALFKNGSGRSQLAAAVTDPQNPLTARVFVNRVWMHHFGEALVRTPSNFGSLGETPTHPELLDWLAAEFVEAGWSIKWLHRKIMLSAAYQRSSQFVEHNFKADGDNRLVWRMSPRRLDAESWRDSLLAVTGELDQTMGGPPTDKVERKRRTLYFKVSRNGDQFASDKFLRLFDFPLMRATVAKRPTSTVPQQYLFMMNSPFMISRAKALMQRLNQAAETTEQRIELAYRLLYGRTPTQIEAKIGEEFVDATSNSTPNPGLSRWEQYAQVLLSSNEFMYLR